MDKGSVSLDGVDVVAWVKEVEDPRRFGVAVREDGVGGSGRIVAFVEKPQELISTEALIGIYYMRELERFGREAQYLMDHGVTGNGEYQLTDAVDRMLKDGAIISTATVTEWLDCGTIPALLETTAIVLGHEQADAHEGAVSDSVLVEPYYIGPGATVTGSVVGPHASIEAGAVVTDSVVRRSVVFSKGRSARASSTARSSGRAPRSKASPGRSTSATTRASASSAEPGVAVRHPAPSSVRRACQRPAATRAARIAANTARMTAALPSARAYPIVSMSMNGYG